MYKGVNLGGWLIQETWMCPVPGENRKWANLNTLEIIEQRFSREEVQELFDTYQDNWITEFDIKEIKRVGCNLIRLPFWYRNFMLDEAGTWINDNFDENPGFKRLDFLLNLASKYGLKVVLDMHGCPGGQSMDHSCGTLATNKLYTDKLCQESLVKLWRAIANRYSNHEAVWAYDLMNEPQNNLGYSGKHSYNPLYSKSWNLSNKIYDMLYKAIREVDKKSKISMQAIWWISNLPRPEIMGWRDVVYQMHIYADTTAFNWTAMNFKRVCDKYGIYGYVGELANLDGVNVCNKLGLSWSTWTYKGSNPNNIVGDFFWYFSRLDRVDPFNDSFEEIKRKWGECLKTENFELQENVVRKVREGCLDS